MRSCRIPNLLFDAGGYLPMAVQSRAPLFSGDSEPPTANRRLLITLLVIIDAAGFTKLLTARSLPVPCIAGSSIPSAWKTCTALVRAMPLPHDGRCTPAKARRYSKIAYYSARIPQTKFELHPRLANFIARDDVHQATISGTASVSYSIA